MMEPETIYCPRRIEDGRGPNSPFLIADGGDAWRADGTCPYCGSMHPDEFMKFVREGACLTPTDKDYKVYVHASGRDKFYFQHLSEIQMREFITLLNLKKINIGAPGYFYRRPFFIAPNPKETHV